MHTVLARQPLSHYKINSNMPGTVCHKINIQCVTSDLLEHAGFLLKCVACVGLRLLHMQDVVVVITSKEPVCPRVELILKIANYIYRFIKCLVNRKQ